MFALVIFFEPDAARVPAAELSALRDLLASVPGLDHAAVFTPAQARDAYVDDGAPPPLGMQLHFQTLEALEAAGITLRGLSDTVPSLSHVPASAQAFWRRTWSVPEPDLATAKGALPCSFVVHYPGPAEDPNEWHDHYIKGHPPLFQRFPGVRAIEILTPVVWISHLDIPKAEHMQRNRILFDSPDALTAALQSPVRHELRADFHTFPAFEGGNFHYPMWTEMVHP